MNSIGQLLKITFFGESHSEMMGIVIDNLAPGIKLDEDLIKSQLKKRRPSDSLSTSRQEQDDYSIVSGYYNNKTTGAPLTIIVYNRDQQSNDYKYLEGKPRPSHADFTAHVKYSGANDPRGGGMFSGRLTVLWMIIGPIAKQILNAKGIYAGSHILSVKNVNDDSFDKLNVNNEFLDSLENSGFPVINSKIEPLMRSEILKAKNDGDSVGGVIESAIINLPVGIGEPLFLSFESYLAQALFSIPGVKGLEFGSGFSMTEKLGSEVNDAFFFENGKVKTRANNNGGILGGLTSGMPVILRLAIKPTPSISKKQGTVDLIKNENTELEITGRHDPAIIQRAIHVVNSVLYFSALDMLLLSQANKWML